MKKSYLLILFAALMSACGGNKTTPVSNLEAEAMTDTVQVAPVVIEREMASADAATFGGIQFGRVRSIVVDDVLAETPEIHFNEQGQLQASKPAEVIIRDKQGRTANHNGGVLDKDTIGFLFRTQYQYIGESNQVLSVLSDNTVNQTTSRNYRRYTYQEDRVYPATMCELLQSGQWPAANYSVYTYTRMDEEGNWLEREVKNYYFERPDFLSPEVMNQLQNDEAMRAAQDQLAAHLDAATPTTYTESRTIEYYP
ncbi:MAG: hypothetical protein IK073_01835 [Paludibacteraceae bacterium]|nr:hypothetical protein [Paludibacteraceae bacterium]